jgi:hypothetical protein
VNVFAALAVFTTTFPKLWVVGVISVGFTPVPLSATVSGLFPAFDAIVSVPAGCVPVVVGVRVTWIVQPVPAASVPEVGHVPPVTVYMDGLAAIELMLSGVIK